jgi:FliI/YscN family ATPase
MIRIESTGSIVQSTQTSMTAMLPLSGIGDYCEVISRQGDRVPSEVIGLSQNSCTLAPLEKSASISGGDFVKCFGQTIQIEVPDPPFGYLLDGLGRGTHISPEKIFSEIESHHQQTQRIKESLTTSPFQRTSLHKQAVTGIKVIDTLLPIAQGQRIGIFASAGLGKSTLLASMAQHFECDCCVVALIGERGREVKEFIDSLSRSTLEKTVVVASTSNELPLMRMKAAHTALSIAETYREQGKHVLFIMDSLTRFARALRDIGLASNELPVRQGYPSSVYCKLPEFIERAGNDQNGSITAFYTVLTNQDGTEDPLADEIRSLLDGHFYLSQKISNQNIRPSIDLNKSISRLTRSLLTNDQLKAQQYMIRLINKWQSEKEFVLFGAELDTEMKSILTHEQLLIEFLSQQPDEYFNLHSSKALLHKIINKIQGNSN